jgi:hypothetical protein
MANAQQHPNVHVQNLPAPLLNADSMAQSSSVPPQESPSPTQGLNVPPPSPTTSLNTPDDAVDFRWLSRSSRGRSYRCPTITSSGNRDLIFLARTILHKLLSIFASSILLFRMGRQGLFRLQQPWRRVAIPIGAFEKDRFAHGERALCNLALRISISIANQFWWPVDVWARGEQVYVRVRPKRRGNHAG